MDMEWSESRREPSIEMDRDDSPMRVHGDGTYDDLEENKTRESSKHRKKDNKNSSRKEEKDHRSKDRERLKLSDKETKDTEKGRVLSRERRKEDRDERDKDRSRDRIREKDYDQREKYKDKEHGHERDKDRKDRGREKDCEREREIEKDGDRGRDKERGKEKNRDRDKEREKERERAKEREREREKEKEKYKDSEKDRDRDIVRAKEKMKGREREADQDTEKLRDKDHVQKKSHGEDYDRNKDEGNDGKYKLDLEDSRDRDLIEQGRNSHHNEDEPSVGGASGGTNSSVPNIMDRISKMKGERLKKKSEDVSEVLAWVNKSRKLEEKRKAEKQKALHLSKIFEEQDNIVQGEEGDEDEYGEPAQHSTYDLAGVKVLHGLDKVIEGGAVVLTLKDQNILADGDVNEEIDMLENVEIGQQKRRDEAYKAAKKKTGVYDDKFNEVPGSEKKMLPQYDDPVADEGITLDQRGRFTGEAEKKLEELRRRIHGGSVNRFENLNSVGKTSTDYYTHEEMLQFKKPKKRKSLRKKDKLDIDALEAEALSAGFGVGDLGARNDAKRQAMNEEQARSEAEMRSNAYQLAFAKADEASKSLRLEQTLPIKVEEDENSAFADDEDDLYKSLQRARKLSLKKQEEAISGPDAIARLASTTISETADDPSLQNGESQENKVVFTEMDEFVWGLQLDEEARKPDSEDFFMEEDEAPKVLEEEEKDETGRWTEVQDTENEEHHVKVHKEEIVPDETIHEAPLGKGLSSVLKLLKDRGTLKESVEWGGRNMDKKKSKLVGIADNDGPKEIHIERLDEFGRIMTQKEAFRTISHKFHGKGPGKMKQEKRQKQYYEELKLKKMKNADTPSQSVERMREAQAQLKSPYLVLSGHVRSGQTSDPRNGFGTVKKDLPGGLTPMLGDRKRKADPDSLDTSKAPKNSRGHSFWMGNGGEF